MNSTRREFFQLTAGSFVAGVLASRARAAARELLPLSLGYSLYGMKMLPLPESLAQCARIGYRNVELCLFPGYPAEPKAFSAEARHAVRQQVDSLGLVISSLM